MIREKNYYLDTFHVTERELETLVSEGLRHGGDYSDLFFENTWGSGVSLRDGEVTGGGFSIDYGCGIRVLKGDKTGYAYSESTEVAALTAAAKAAGAIADGGTASATAAGCAHGTMAAPGTAQATAREILQGSKDAAAPFVASESNGGRLVRKFFRGAPNPAADRYAILRDWKDESAAAQKDFLLRVDKAIKARDSRVIKVQASLSAEEGDVLMFNSFGELKYDTRPMSTLAVSVIYSQNGAVENKGVSRSFRCGAEFLTDGLLDEIVEKATTGIDQRFEARRPHGGQMSVVMGAGASGILLHEAMGHAFEADFNRKGQSIFCDKMGRRICPKGITIVDDATLHGNRGALNFDDEGVPGQRTVMVEDGVLASYLHDRISARFYAVTPTGNGRRESFRYEPLPRMRATYMEAGDAKPSDIIASVKKGIYVDEFQNGQVKIGEGDFTFYVNSGRLIEDGRLTMPIKDINIIGNGPRALADIRAVGDDLVIDPVAWTCGKGQNAPVSCGIPTVLVGNLTVGGE